MFCSSTVHSTNIVENMRIRSDRNIIKEFAEELKKECDEYDFGLEKSFCYVNDLTLSMNCYQNSCPKNGKYFFKESFQSLKVQFI